MPRTSRIGVPLGSAARRLACCLCAMSLVALLAPEPQSALAGEVLDQAQVAEENSGASPPATFVGTASVIDGDTIVIDGQQIEFYGIDAPEIEQTCTVLVFSWTCGEEARKMLSALVADKEVACIEKSRDADSHSFAVCRTSGVLLNEAMVRIGMALAFRPQSKDYVDDETAAQQEEVGVWRSRFEPPWEWRDKNGKPDRTALNRPASW